MMVFFQFFISKKNLPLEDHQSTDLVTIIMVLTFPPNEFNPIMFLLYTVLFIIITLYKVVITLTIQIKVTE